MYFTFNDYLLILTCSFTCILYYKLKSLILISDDNNYIIAQKINKNTRDIDILYEKLDKII
jgi:hypothetical protein